MTDEKTDQILRASMRVIVERDRAIYWLLEAIARLEALDWDTRSGNVSAVSETVSDARRALAVLGYPPGGERAQRLLALGEPGGAPHGPGGAARSALHVPARSRGGGLSRLRRQGAARRGPGGIEVAIARAMERPAVAWFRIVA